MNRKRKIGILVGLPVIVLGLLIYYLSKHTIPVLEPAGTIASKERHLMIIAILLSAIVVIPVYALTIMIAVKYRESNKKARYEPDFDHSRALESIWWGVPIVIIFILSVITWNSTHALNPYSEIDTGKTSMSVEVVSLNWKWLFIYPSLGVASVNRLEMPINQPVHFYITSDTVMNSFWVPALGGQIYAMPGMTTQLNLDATKLGSFYGSSANISGEGFSGMNFDAVSVSQSDFNNWVNNVRSSSGSLSYSAYVNLAKPSQYNPVSYYKDPANNLFEAIINQYMIPDKGLSVGAGS